MTSDHLSPESFEGIGGLSAPTPGWPFAAYAVHAYTASGAAMAFLATAEICRDTPDPRWVFAWLLVAVAIDATDGPLARRFQVKRRLPRIAGRTIDDLVDYLTFTFVPLLLVWRMDWLPPPAGLWTAAAMMASLFGFAATDAKQEEEGFFRGFPSYWNIYAFYAGILSTRLGTPPSGLLIVVLTVLTVAPVRFVYPNLAPRPWRWPVLAGAGIWAAMLLAMLPSYPKSPAWLVWLSLVYPALYVALSVYLDARHKCRG
jgi:phosphatidylcholine synthase